MRILVADDHPIFRAGLKEILAKDPEVKSIGEAEDGHKAMELARKKRWDAVVLDITMPGRDGLVAAIEWQAREFQSRSGIRCGLSLPQEDVAVDRDRATAIFRILQESLTNVAQHANASRVWIRFEERGGAWVLEVRDDGKGIDPKDIFSLTSLGFLGMRERALAFRGHLQVEGGPGKGTIVTLRVPVKRE